MSDVNEFIVEDYLETARSRATSAFSGKDIFDRYLQLLLIEITELQSALEQLQTQRSLDTATGVNLDNLGYIVGVERGNLTASLFTYFGYIDADGVEENPYAGSYGSSTDTSVGSMYWDGEQPFSATRLPTDDEYRLIIKAKIAKNVSNCSPESVISAYKFLFGTNTCTIQEYDDSTVEIGIGKILSAVEKGLLFNLGGVGDLLPRTAGVDFIFKELNEDKVFAFDGYPDGLGFGDLTDSSQGGYFASLVSN